jgi:hypothetical protein
VPNAGGVRRKQSSEQSVRSRERSKLLDKAKLDIPASQRRCEGCLRSECVSAASKIFSVVIIQSAVVLMRVRAHGVVVESRFLCVYVYVYVLDGLRKGY